MKEKKKIGLEEKILNLSLLGSILFTISEGAMFFITHSHSILMDCIFDGADLIMIGPFLLLVPLLYRPVSENHPYGFSQVESLFVIIKYGVLMAITIMLIIENVRTIYNGGRSVDGGKIAFFEISLGIGCVCMYFLLRHFSQKYSSMIIKAELYMWKVDIAGSIGVGIAFFAQMLLQKSKYSDIAAFVDPVVAIVMAVFLLIEPVKLIGKNMKELVLFAPSHAVRDQIREVVEKHLTRYSYELKFLDVIQTGRKTWVEVYIGSVTDMIQISHMHQVRNSIKKELESRFDQLYVELIPDLPDE